MAVPDELPPFACALMRCDDSTSVTLPNGSRFIRKLPDERPLGYLHKLFAPLSPAGLMSLSTMLGRRLPAQFEAFLGWSNGATLFDNSFCIFGFQEGLAVSRSIELEAQTAINIAWENEIYACVHPQQWNEGWIRIGSVTGWDSTFHIDGHESGECAISGEAGGRRTFPTFNSCIERIVMRLSPCFSCDGLVDPRSAEREAALRSLVYDG